MPHFCGLIWERPRFLVLNLRKFQNFELNLKEILDYRVIFEKKTCPR